MTISHVISRAIKRSTACLSFGNGSLQRALAWFQQPTVLRHSFFQEDDAFERGLDARLAQPRDARLNEGEHPEDADYNTDGGSDNGQDVRHDLRGGGGRG